MSQFFKKVLRRLFAHSNAQRQINGNIISGKGGAIRVGPGGSVNGLKIIGLENTISIRDDQSSFEINQSDSSFFCSHEEISENSQLYIIEGDGTGSFGQLFTFSGNIDANFKIIRHPDGFIIQGTVKVSRGGSFNFNRDYLTGCGCTYDSSKLKTSGGVTFN